MKSIILGLLIAVSASLAGVPPSSKPPAPWLPIKTDGLLRSNRLELAISMHSRIDAALGAIPHVSPSEENWVLNESERLSRLLQETRGKEATDRLLKQHEKFFWSDEHVRWKARTQLETLRAQLRNIINDNGNRIDIWALTLSILMDNDTRACLQKLEDNDDIPLVVTLMSVWHKQIASSVVFVNVNVMEEALREANIVLTNTAAWQRLAPKTIEESPE